MKIYNRSAWTSRNARNRVALDFGAVKHIAVHWPGSKGRLDPAKTAAYLRGWQAYHMDIKRWTDIAYNEAIDLNGDVWVCRGDFKDGATFGHGGKSYSILVVLGQDDVPSEAMLASLKIRMEKQRARSASACKVVGHRELVQTECPGDRIMAWLKTPTSKPTVDPKAFPLPAGFYFGPKDGPKESVSGYFNKRSDGKAGHDGLLLAQKQLQTLKLLKGSPDGLYGSDTEQATKGLQSLANKQGANLSVDGLIGSETWSWIWKVKVETVPVPDPTPAPVPDSTEVTVATYNTWSYAAPAFSKRLPAIMKSIKAAKADVVLLTEAPSSYRDKIRAGLPGGADRWKVWTREDEAVLFDADRFSYEDGATPRRFGPTDRHGGVFARLVDKKTKQAFVFGSYHLPPNSVSSDAYQKREIGEFLAEMRKLDGIRIVGGDGVNDDNWLPGWNSARTKAKVAPNRNAKTFEKKAITDRIHSDSKTPVTWTKYEVIPGSGSNHDLVVATFTTGV